MFVVLGEALVDMVIKDTSTVKTYFGGGPLNTAIALARLDEEVCFNFPVSTDYYGQKTLELLKDNNIKYIYPKLSELPTTLAMSSLDSEGKSTYQFYRNQTAQRDIDKELISCVVPKNTKCIHTGTLAIAEEPDVSIIESVLLNSKANDIVISIDPNIRANNFKDKDTYRKNVFKIMATADIIKLSDDDIEFLYPQKTLENSIQLLKQQFNLCSLLVITRGKNATIVSSFKHHIECQLDTIKVVDTIGAGDCFIAGLLHALMQKSLLDKNSLKEIEKEQLFAVIKTANIVAGLNCTQNGCNPPYKTQVVR
jgi:fructokinase